MKGSMNAEGVKRLWDKYKYALTVAAIGAALMLWPAERNSPQTLEPFRTAEIISGTPAQQRTVREMQSEMEQILGKIEGVGQVQVLLTEETDGERQLAQDITRSRRGSGEIPDETSESLQPVRMDAGSRDEAVIIRTLSPTYRGALIVCQGGDRAAVRLAVTQAVSALTGLPSDRIAVAKCP